MDALKAALQVVIADNFLFYFRSHSYHWNVEGMFFNQLHDFFGDVYTDSWGALDVYVEELRKLGEYGPHSLMDLYNYKTATEDSMKPMTGTAMLANLLAANTQLLANLSHLFDLATAEKQQGLANFVADRMGTHKKYEWMIKSLLNVSGA